MWSKNKGTHSALKDLTLFPESQSAVPVHLKQTAIKVYKGMTATHAHTSKSEKSVKTTDTHRETEIKTENSGSTVGLITTW